MTDQLWSATTEPIGQTVASLSPKLESSVFLFLISILSLHNFLVYFTCQTHSSLSMLFIKTHMLFMHDSSVKLTKQLHITQNAYIHHFMMHTSTCKTCLLMWMKNLHLWTYEISLDFNKFPFLKYESIRFLYKLIYIKRQYLTQSDKKLTYI